MERISDVGKEVEKVLKKIAPKLRAAPRKIVSVRTKRPPTIYLKAVSLGDLSDVGKIKSEIELGNVVICYLRPLADKDLGLMRKAVSELATFLSDVGGDIAQLGEERIVATPFFVKIWRKRES